MRARNKSALLDSYKIKKKLSPPQMMIVGFGLLIIIGTALLTLPIASRNFQWTNPLDALFTSTSAVCVTGLVTVDTATYWNTFGKSVILMLIQVGGLGFMCFGAGIALFFGKKINLRNRILIKEALNQDKIAGTVRLIKAVIAITFIIELLGALLLSIVFVPKFGLKKGLAFSIFHSVSAFCNAGFDLLGTNHHHFISLCDFSDNTLLLGTISGLIILGGLGFNVILCIIGKVAFKEYDLTSKLAIISTISLLIVGTLIFFAGEFHNPNTIGTMDFKGKLLNSFFQSVTTRTAGFNSVDLTGARESTLFTMIVFMFIGASPASTGGGIKTTTVAVLFLTFIAFLKNDNEITVFGRRLKNFVIRKSIGILFIGLCFIMTATYMLTVTQSGNFNLLNSSFEAVSAFATVGLSLGGTSSLNPLGKALIIFLMFTGRVGTLTLFSLMIKESKVKKVRYPKADVMVG